jgi:short-subunit dehydrogenase
MEVKNKNIVITGASRGIGWELAKALAKEQASLHLVQRTWDSNKLDELKTLGAVKVVPWTCDLTKTESIINLGNSLAKENIDILINNAGILTGELLEKQTNIEIVDVFQLNLVASALLIKSVLPGMLVRRAGKIINNTSVSAYMRFPCATTYAAAKSGLLAMTECLETELSNTGVATLALVTPGIKTDMFDQIKASYGKYFDSPADYISAEDYAIQIITAIKRDDRYLMPKGATRLGLFMTKYTPSLFKKFVVGNFDRNRA